MQDLTIFKKSISKEIKTISNLVGEENSKRFISSCVSCFQNVPQLAKCTPASLMNAFIESARVGLYPSNSIGEAYILPYKSYVPPYGINAQFQIGYQGFITLFWRAGVSSVDSQIVYENDEFEFSYGFEPTLVHKPALTNRGLPIAVYAIVKVQNEKIFKIMSCEDIDKIKGMSASVKADKKKETKKSIWEESKDPEKWMWKKTVIKQLAKLLPKTEKLSRAIEVDNICERGGSFGERKGEIIEIPFNVEDEKIDEVKKKQEKMRKSKTPITDMV